MVFRTRRLVLAHLMRKPVTCLCLCAFPHAWTGWCRVPSVRTGLGWS